MRILDTHLHMIYLDKFSYPWLEGTPLNRAWPLDSYLATARELGIDGAVHMEVDVAEKDIEAETSFVVGLDRFIRGAIISGRPEKPGFAAALERAAAIPGVKGMRRILHTSPDELSGSDLFAENIRRLAAHGMTFDLCVLARQLPVGQRLVDRCPGVSFILDHCGVPDIADGDFETWSKAISELALRPNVAAKISGIIAYGGENWTIEDLRPYFEHVIAAFGWDRVVWGSDFPVCTLTADLRTWVDVTHRLLAGTSEAEQSKLLSANAQRIYRI
jgi:predicted TIM-barrel fold metal-dependent hydrolase